MREMGPSDAQWSKLLQLIAGDKELLHTQFLAPGGVVRVPAKWEAIAIELNKIPGCKKTGEKWHAAWIGLRGRARQALRLKNAYRQRTGGGPSANVAGLKLSELHQKVINLNGTTAALGTGCPNPLQLNLARDRAAAPEDAVNAAAPLVLPAPQDAVNAAAPLVLPAPQDAVNAAAPHVLPAPLVLPAPQEAVNAAAPLVLPVAVEFDAPLEFLVDGNDVGHWSPLNDDQWIGASLFVKEEEKEDLLGAAALPRLKQEVKGEASEIIYLTDSDDDSKQQTYAAVKQEDSDDVVTLSDSPYQLMYQTPLRGSGLPLAAKRRLLKKNAVVSPMQYEAQPGPDADTDHVKALIRANTLVMKEVIGFVRNLKMTR
ncbi:uncharacterized protein LOC113213056 isoform X2 [Frankliniella occidentalis]|uniref:Uncharacterized protein LOC113213056 isoform X2 n=1 Tax=Frankliniella occidentalis TaxID=133901 RepID=A0A9C6WX72_FRAOC|nr:uncharacterized protein LOC113213056 isoform X2 [Frankliniella occidentalis]